MNVVELALALIFVLLSNLAFVSAQEKEECLKHFWLKNPDFDTCWNRTCFIFLRQEPYIVLNEDIMSRLYANRSLVLNCKDSNDIPGMGGSAFKFIRRTAAKKRSLCLGWP